MHILGWFVNQDFCLIPVAGIIESGSLMVVKFFCTEENNVLINPDTFHINRQYFFGSPYEAFSFVGDYPFWFFCRREIILYPIKKILEEQRDGLEFYLGNGNKLKRAFCKDDFFLGKEKNLAVLEMVKMIRKQNSLNKEKK